MKAHIAVDADPPYRGLAKNAAQVTTLFMLFDLWVARRKLLAAVASVRLEMARRAQMRRRGA